MTPDPSNSCRFLRGYPRANWTSRVTANGSHMFPILIAHFGAAALDGSDRLQLTYPPVLAGLPRWSPDATQIAYVAGQSGRPLQMFLISAQGGAPQQMLAENHPQLDATWSPEGKKIAFGRNGASGSEGQIISIIDLVTHQVSTVPGSQNLFSPRWSPDGQYLAALNLDSTKLLLFRFQDPESGRTGLLSQAWWVISTGRKMEVIFTTTTASLTIRRFAGLRSARPARSFWSI